MQTTIIFVAISATIALTSASPYGYNEDSSGFQGRAQYQFEYGVNDPQTGDIKTQREQRDGQQLTGQYTLREADGTTRIVRYRAGPQSGFEADVQRVGQAQHPVQFGQGFGQRHHHGYGNANNFEGADGRSFIGATQWINQGSGGNSLYGNQGYSGHNY